MAAAAYVRANPQPPPAPKDNGKGTMSKGKGQDKGVKGKGKEKPSEEAWAVEKLAQASEHYRVPRTSRQTLPWALKKIQSKSRIT